MLMHIYIPPLVFYCKRVLPAMGTLLSGVFDMHGDVSAQIDLL